MMIRIVGAMKCNKILIKVLKTVIVKIEDGSVLSSRKERTRTNGCEKQLA